MSEFSISVSSLFDFSSLNEDLVSGRSVRSLKDPGGCVLVLCQFEFEFQMLKAQEIRLEFGSTF